MKNLFYIALLPALIFGTGMDMGAQPKAINDNSTQQTGDAGLHITNYLLFDSKKGVLVDKTEDLLQSNTIRLSPGDKFFRLDFQFPDSNKGIRHYAYMIEGFDNDWNYIDENFIRISGLPDGKYNLRIRAQQVEGDWSTRELNIPVRVIPTLLSIWWFRLLLFVLFVSIGYAFIRFRIYELAKSKKVLENTVKERTLQLNTLLEEKEVLLKEIHHRVKNNLQVISGLLDLQGKKSEDAGILNILAESRGRLRSIALIHQNLYQFENISSIEFKRFLEGLCNQVAELFQKEKQKVQIISEVPFTELDIDTAIPLGLILNELLTNSYKYAFDKIEEGIIKIKLLQLSEGRYELIYSDNGPGLPPDFDHSKSNSIGLTLINDLSRQLGGTVQYKMDKESTFIITFTNQSFRKKED